jgi:hypothetical protein
MLAVGEIERARAAADELSSIAAELGAPFIAACAAQALGAVELAVGDARAALVPLSEARAQWQELDAPYEAARTRELIGLACRALGDRERAVAEQWRRGQLRRSAAQSGELARTWSPPG